MQLKRVIEKYNLNIINENEQGKEQGEERSMIDYVITSQKYMDTIKSMEIDEKNNTDYTKLNIRINK